MVLESKLHLSWKVRACRLDGCYVDIFALLYPEMDGKKTREP